MECGGIDLLAMGIGEEISSNPKVPFDGTSFKQNHTVSGSNIGNH